ncbi:MAG: nuclear transport factor 2 family protein [Gemmatimonadaceae bacterium]
MNRYVSHRRRRARLFAGLLAVATAPALASVSVFSSSFVQDDRGALIAVERRWLAAEHDSATLEAILAPDFVHVVPTGDLLTKAQHIHYSALVRPPAGERRQFDTLTVRVYGDVGIVSGIVRATDPNGKVDRSIFTDVFDRRNGRWQAVNAQENHVDPRRPPQ